MHFEGLPHDVQVIAAQTLSGLMLKEGEPKKDPLVLANEVSWAFSGLYSRHELDDIKQQISWVAKRLSELTEIKPDEISRLVGTLCAIRVP